LTSKKKENFMAIMRLSTNPTTVGIPDEVTITGITHVSSASAEKSLGTVVRAKDSDGEIVAALVGKESYALNVSGYSTTADGPELGSEIAVGGLAGKVTSVNIERSVEDFTRFSADGRGIPDQT
jgi:hypothetical protein